MPETVSKPIIELIRTAAWGDVLMTTATLAGLKVQGYHIRYVTTESLSTLLTHHPLVDEVVVIPPSRTGNWWRYQKTRQLVAEATASQGLEPAQKQILFTNSLAYSGLRSLLDNFRPGLGETFPAVEHHLAHVCQQAAVPYSESMQVVLTEEEREWGQQFEDAVLLHLFTSNPLKDWPVDRYKDLAQRIQSDFGLRVLQVGKPWHAGADQVESINNPSMRHAIAAVAQCKLFVGGDSIFNHVSRAFQKPSVVLFGLTHPGQFGYEQNINLWKGQQWPFRGVRPGYLPPTSHTHPAMAANSVEQVYTAVASQLSQQSQTQQIQVPQTVSV